MLRFLRRTFGRRSMQRYGRGAGRGAGRGGLGCEGDERDGGLRGAAAAAVVSGGFPSSPHPGGVVHGAGAPVHIPAAGGSKPVLQCRVLLLDGTEVSVELPVSNAVRADPSASPLRPLASLPCSPLAARIHLLPGAARLPLWPRPLFPRSERGERHLRLRHPPQPQPEPLGGSSVPRRAARPPSRPRLRPRIGGLAASNLWSRCGGAVGPSVRGRLRTFRSPASAAFRSAVGRGRVPLLGAFRRRRSPVGALLAYRGGAAR